MSSAKLFKSLKKSTMRHSRIWRKQHSLWNWTVFSLTLLTFLQWSISLLTSFSALLVGYATIGGGLEWLYVACRTVFRDLFALIGYLRIQFFIYRMRSKNLSVPKIFSTVAARYPNKILFHYNDDSWTFKQIDEFSNRIANYFIKEGYQKGDEIALFLDNRPEYVGIWLGLAKAGIVSALVNTNQRGKTLIHSLLVVHCKAVIFGSDLLQAVNDITDSDEIQKSQLKYYCFETNISKSHFDNFEIIDNPNSNKFYETINEKIQASSDQPPFSSINKVAFSDFLFYIYTSGTTGLPKAAIIRNSRFLLMGAGLKFMIWIRKNDVLYTSLPLYHMAGGTIGVCQGLVFGNTIAIRNKFSASNFWKDCIKYKCTVAQYIGEICRYLLSQPESQYDRAHSVRMMFGNGLRSSIWSDFVKRFEIKKIGELYGSTEGNTNIINVDNKEGSCGFISCIIPSFYPVTLIHVNEETGEPIRDANGLCVRAKPGETGEFVGKIINNDPLKAFDGYANKEANQKKLIRNVFKKGDCAFASGDLLVMDRFGYFYFKDRCGDTFRWKGENVSTMELEAIISNTIELADCVVYGVEIPKCEGKAGMAAILDPNHSIDLDNFLKKIRLSVPAFMIPVFVRLVDKLEVTGTLKLPKTTYRNQGFDLNVINDPIYVLDIKNMKYNLMDKEIFNQIIDGQMKL